MKFLFVFSLCFSALGFSQATFFSSESIADCSGATGIIYPGSYTLQFPDSKGKVDDLVAYGSLQKINEKNSLWCYFIAPHDGKLSIDAQIVAGTLQMIAFQNDEDDLCVGLQKGSTEIKRIIDQQLSNKVGLSVNVNENNLYPLEIKKGQKVMFLFNTQEKGKPTLDFNLKFERLDANFNAEEEKTRLVKEVDVRINSAKPVLNIKVRDAETGNPIVANIEVNGIKKLAALYNGSDFLFNIDKSGLIDVKCDAPGYFFSDKREEISSHDNREFTIWMEPLGKGKSLRLDDIEFQSGTSTLTLAAEEKLRRLRDFLALNAGIKIEIQGHVHSTGENCFAAQKLSEARARRVYLFLDENGIDKNRMSSVGYGNTKPIYENPKFSHEEQANRRVEIKVM
jgi:outer membrane protein OmpA-like peptidoglycan-associated protein